MPPLEAMGSSTDVISFQDGLQQTFVYFGQNRNFLQHKGGDSNRGWIFFLLSIYHFSSDPMLSHRWGAWDS
jgi:hypothetical protein